eukprot:12658080-Ditylum_brightwellii.AAC.1
MDCIQLFQLNGAILSNDAAACYDHMIPELTLVHLQALGMPENAIKTSILLNHKAKHFAKTKLGVTTEYYQSTENCQSYKEGQEKGSSPSNWLFQVLTLLAALHSLCTGLKMVSVCKCKKANQVVNTYVKNMGNIYVNKEKEEMPENIRDSMKLIAQT